MRQRRYPGIRPFETAESHLFFGRDRDVRDLNVLIMLERMVVLFGRSGYGKSSLINAGLLPMLSQISELDETPNIPILVRFGSFSPDVDRSLLDIVQGRLNEIIPQEMSHFLDHLVSEQTLWYHFKKRQNLSPNEQNPNKQNRYLLIFDQFEEFFTYPFAQQEALKSQLAELVYTEIPQTVRTQVGSLNKDQRHVLVEPLDVKVLFSIRADRINLLHAFGSKFPSILDKRNRYELKGLSFSQANEAIIGPAQQNGEFESPVFTYSDATLRTIEEKLSETRPSEERSGIETFQLQVLCEYMESEIIAGHIPSNRIEPVHFAHKINDIYEGYYLRLLNKLPPQKAQAAQKLIEESLLFEDEKTSEARRLSVDADVLVQRYADAGITHDILRELENAFLLRRELTSVGGFSYEVSHDTLIGAILNLKKERKAQESATLERSITRKRQVRLAILAAIIIGILAIAIGIVLFVIRLKNEAEQNLVIALENEIKAKQAFDQASQNQQLAENERFRAETNFADAQVARTRMEQTLTDLERAQINATRLLFRDARHYFNRIKYDKVLERIKEFQAIIASNPSNILLKNPILFQDWQSLSLEMIYFQNETGHTDNALEYL